MADFAGCVLDPSYAGCISNLEGLGAVCRYVDGHLVVGVPQIIVEIFGLGSIANLYRYILPTNKRRCSGSWPDCGAGTGS